MTEPAGLLQSKHYHEQQVGGLYFTPGVGGANGIANERVFPEGRGIISMAASLTYASSLLDYTGRVVGAFHIRHNSPDQPNISGDTGYPNKHWGQFYITGWLEPTGKVVWATNHLSWKFRRPTRINRETLGGVVPRQNGSGQMVASLLRVHIDLLVWPGSTDPDPNKQNQTLARWVPKWSMEVA